MFRPRSIKIIFRAELLPRLGRFSEPDIRPFIEKYIADHAWLWGPTIYADITPDGFVDLTFKGFHWRRSKRAVKADDDGGIAHGYELEPGEIWVPLPAVNEPPGDAAQERGGGHAHKRMPPVKILSDSRNAGHPAIKSPRLAQVQK